MKKEKIKIKSISYFQIITLIVATFAFAYLVAIPETKLVSAEVTSCCERTISGAWCQNAPSSECDPNYLSTPTSCDSTSYCKLGCCYDSQEGLCMENTPEKICIMNNGTWADSSSCSIPQCNLGCCVLNGQAAFVTLARCKKLSSFYGISTDFRNTITSELQCVSLASLEDKGACVYEVDYSKTCKFTTRNDCNEIGSKKIAGNQTITSNITFYKDKLCSSEELATNCGPSEKTTCYEGKVYFIDTCGNIANIYDSLRIKDKVYWDKVISVEDSCGNGNSNANSASCGNCDYLQGSRCGDYKLGGTRPTYGDYICRDLNCNIDGKIYKHGESWCSTDKYNDSVGSRYYRHICADGEEIIEPCADFRNQVCTQDVIKTSAGDFLQAGCTINRWYDCTSQTTKEDCLNTDKRDCKWIYNKDEVEENSTIACVPLNAPGFDFWTDNNAPICSQASTTCVVTYEKGLIGGKKCVDNCECLTDSWKEAQEKKCQALGDCGGKINYIGVKGKAKTTSSGKQTSSFSGQFQNPQGNFNNPTAKLFLPLAQIVLFLFEDVKEVRGESWVEDTTEGWYKIEVNGKTFRYHKGSGLYYIPGSLLGSSSPPPEVPSFYESQAPKKDPTITPDPTQTEVAKILGIKDKATAQIVNGFGTALMIVAAIQMFGSMMGLNQKLTSALSKATFAGIMTKTLIETFSEKGKIGGWIGEHAGLVGLGVGIIVFLMTYKTESKEIVKFECNLYEAPVGGKDCEKCNDDKLTCSEYRCKSLGQACQILNAGTKDQKCAWVNPKDVTSPIITPWKEVLTKDHVYVNDTSIRPPALGVKILNTKSSDKCLKAFSPITFGVTTNEPSQCKIDYNHTTTFEDMQYFMDNSNLYSYNHSQTLNLPSPEHLSSIEPTLKHDGKFTLFIRCKDANGNYNVDEFAVSFCVEKGPDTTAPIIEEVNPVNNAPVQYDLDSISVDVYTNEPAECKWSKINQDYDNMENNMTCYNQIYQQDSRGFYRCIANLTGLENRKENIYYFKCKDQPWLTNSADRNKNTESYVYVLRGSQPLDIIKVSPNQTTVSSSSNVVPVTLEIETSNGESNKGDATCYYSQSPNDNFVKMFITGTNLHSQRQDLTSGDYTYYFRCIDLGGNLANTSTSFKVYVDNDAPIVIRAYQDSSRLKIITNENSSCYYSINSEKKCDFLITEGISMPYANKTEHYADWQEGKTYYIKCEDSSGNQPINTKCSIMINMISK